MNQIKKLETWRRELALSETFEEIKLHDSAASAAAEFARREKLSYEKQNEIGVFRCDIEAKKGEWLNANFAHGKHDKRGNQYVERLCSDDLSKMPATKGESAQARKIHKIADEKPKVFEEIKQKIVESGEVITPRKVYKEIKKEERKNEIQKQKEEITILAPIEGSYDILVIDPPWPYGREYDPEGSRVANPYPEMSIEEITDINLPTKDDGILLLWTTHKFLPDSFDIMKAWGFDYKATMVWNKEKIGMGHWLRMQCEFCLLGIKGKPIWDVTNWRDIITEARKQHSRKPESFFEAIDEHFPYYSKLEYFSREKREGWESFGNDINKF